MFCLFSRTYRGFNRVITNTLLIPSLRLARRLYCKYNYTHTKTRYCEKLHIFSCAIFFRTFQEFCAYSIQTWWRGVMARCRKLPSVRIMKSFTTLDATLTIQRAWRRHVVSCANYCLLT